MGLDQCLVTAVDGATLVAQDERGCSERGVTMYAASGYRSPERQRQIFVDELVAAAGTPLTSSQTSDAAIDQVLEGHAPPGFSKHQTGNAIDLAVPGLSLAQFRETDAFSWLAAENFANAHRFGFAPSYPDGVDGLGPAPEPWEWIWVGVDVLFRCPPPN